MCSKWLSSTFLLEMVDKVLKINSLDGENHNHQTTVVGVNNLKTTLGVQTQTLTQATTVLDGAIMLQIMDGIIAITDGVLVLITMDQTGVPTTLPPMAGEQIITVGETIIVVGELRTMDGVSLHLLVLELLLVAMSHLETQTQSLLKAVQTLWMP